MTLPLVVVCAGFLLELATGRSAVALPMAVFGSALLTATVAWIWGRCDGEIARY
jgi:hypothetical protein